MNEALYLTYAKLNEEELEQKLVTQKTGLSSSEVHKRLVRFGPNDLPVVRPTSLIVIFLRQFKNILIWLMLVATVVSYFLKRVSDAIFILFTLSISALIGTYQEYKASRILADLSVLTKPQAKVRREDKIELIEASDLVPGDIIILEAGNFVPADSRLILAHGLELNESLLTGESFPAGKETEVIPHPGKIMDMTNCVFTGTTVARGRGEAIVYATGSRTELGQIAAKLTQTHPPLSPLQQQIGRFARGALIGIAVMIIVMFIIGIILGKDASDMLLTSIALAVAAIPEGLPALVTVVMVFGMQKMATHKALVQNQTAIETLGQTQILMTDKTGTLTQNRLAVVSVCLPNKLTYNIVPVEDLSPFTLGLNQILNVCFLCNDASGLDQQTATDDPVDVALQNFAHRLSYNRVAKHSLPRTFEIPFSSELKLMATFHRKGNANTQIYLKGAPVDLLKLCGAAADPAGKHPLSPEQKKAFLKRLEEPARRGEKLIATAEAVVPTALLEKVNWRHLAIMQIIRDRAVLTGAVTLSDPIREEAERTVKQAKAAGIRVIMVTGDNAAVAMTIGQKLNLAGEPVTILPTNELARKRMIDNSDIYAQVTPSMKLELIKDFQEQGYVVAMTGDGVNDTLALTQADIGLAMGRRGTDTARQAADIIMLDDNIATIVKAIKSGRTIFRNIQKIMAYFLSTNLAEVLVLFVAIVSGNLLPIPLLPAQILWINLVTDGLTVVPLALEPDHVDIMRRPPRKRSDSLFSPIIKQNMVIVTLIILGLTLGSFAYTWFTTKDLVIARTVAFCTLSVSQVFNLLSARSAKTSFFTLGVLTNPALVITFWSAILLQFAILFIPITQKYLSVAPLSTAYIVGIFFLSSLAFWLMELKKLVFKPALA